MKFKVDIKEEQLEEVLEFLQAHGIEVDPDGEYVIHDNHPYSPYLYLKDARQEKKHIPTIDIMYLESFDHDVEVHTTSGIYYSTSPLTKTMNDLDPQSFLRISSSVIVNRHHIKEIIPSISMKFTLLMNNGKKVTVTRSYYYTFKDYFHI